MTNAMIPKHSTDLVFQYTAQYTSKVDLDFYHENLFPEGIAITFQ